MMKKTAYRSDYTRALSALSISSVITLLAVAAIARQEAMVQLPKSRSVAEVLQQVVHTENVAVAAEVTEEGVFKETSGPATLTLTAALDEAKNHLGAPGYHRLEDGSICFETRTQVPKPQIHMKREFDQDLRVTQGVNRLLDSFTAEQMQELRDGGFRIKSTSLTPEQQEMLGGLCTGLTARSGNGSFFASPGAQVELNFRTMMTVWPADGTSPVTAQIGATTPAKRVARKEN